MLGQLAGANAGGKERVRDGKKWKEG